MNRQPPIVVSDRSHIIAHQTSSSEVNKPSFIGGLRQRREVIPSQFMPQQQQAALPSGVGGSDLDDVDDGNNEDEEDRSESGEELNPLCFRLWKRSGCSRVVYVFCPGYTPFFIIGVFSLVMCFLALRHGTNEVQPPWAGYAAFLFVIIIFLVLWMIARFLWMSFISKRVLPEVRFIIAMNAILDPHLSYFLATISSCLFWAYMPASNVKGSRWDNILQISMLSNENQDLSYLLRTNLFLILWTGRDLLLSITTFSFLTGFLMAFNSNTTKYLTLYALVRRLNASWMKLMLDLSSATTLQLRTSSDFMQDWLASHDMKESENNKVVAADSVPLQRLLTKEPETLMREAPDRRVQSPSLHAIGRFMFDIRRKSETEKEMQKIELSGCTMPKLLSKKQIRETTESNFMNLLAIEYCRQYPAAFFVKGTRIELTDKETAQKAAEEMFDEIKKVRDSLVPKKVNEDEKNRLAREAIMQLRERKEKNGVETEASRQQKKSRPFLNFFGFRKKEKEAKDVNSIQQQTTKALAQLSPEELREHTTPHRKKAAAANEGRQAKAMSPIYENSETEKIRRQFQESGIHQIDPPPTEEQSSNEMSADDIGDHSDNNSDYRRPQKLVNDIDAILGMERGNFIDDEFLEIDLGTKIGTQRNGGVETDDSVLQNSSDCESHISINDILLKNNSSWEVDSNADSLMSQALKDAEIIIPPQQQQCHYSDILHQKPLATTTRGQTRQESTSRKENTEYLTKEFLELFLGDQIDEFMKKADLGARGRISKRSLTRLVLDVYRLRKQLIHLIGSQEALRKIVGRMISIGLTFLLILVFLFILGIPGDTIIISGTAVLSSVTVILSFLYTGFVQAVIFVCFLNPYNVGDRITLDGEVHIVRKIHTYFTEFITMTNRPETLTHASLFTRMLFNESRNKQAGLEIPLNIDFLTPPSKCEALHYSIEQFVNRNTEYVKDSAFWLQMQEQIGHFVQFTYWINCVDSWGQFKTVMVSRGKLWKFINKELERLQIGYRRTPAQITFDQF